MAATHPHSVRRAATAGAAAALLAAAVVVAVAGCASGGARHPDAEQRAAQCDADRPGVLRIANFTGRVVDIYAMRPMDHWRVFIAQVSTGTTELDVPGPADLGVRYDAVEPSHGEPLGTVTWIRSRSRASGPMSLLLELECAS